jgi:hypothetical protein
LSVQLIFSILLQSHISNASSFIMSSFLASKFQSHIGVRSTLEFLLSLPLWVFLDLLLVVLSCFQSI